MRKKLREWFYSTWLGGWYLELVLFIDEQRNPKSTGYLTPKEMAQIVRESRQIAEGTTLMKKRINDLVTSKDKASYHKTLSEIEDMVKFAKGDENTGSAKLAEVARQMYVKKGSKDIVTVTDHAKMVEKRIEDMYELQEQRARHQLMRKIRNLRLEGKTEEAAKLQEEWFNKYGRRSI